MKQCDACAVRGFDSERILQRKFFRKLELPTGTDEEIFDTFNVSSLKDSVTMTARLDDLRGLKTKVAAYTKRILNHHAKLEKFFDKAGDDKEKFRVWQLRQRYAEVSNQLGNMQVNLNHIERVGEKDLDEQRKREFATRLKQARRTAGLTQMDVALKLRQSATGYASYEQGKNEPSIAMLIRICEVLRTSADKLLGIEK